MENLPLKENLNETAVLYVADIPNNQAIGHVYPIERDLEICACNDPHLAKQKYFVWELLSRALEDTIGKSVNLAGLYKDIHGVWRCNDVYFSLSHSKNALAVAVSDYPVGVDIERVDVARFNERLAQRILTEREKKQYDEIFDINVGEYLRESFAYNKSMFLAKRWTQKESIFKQTQCKTSVCQIETADFNTYLGDALIKGERYAYSVAFKQGLEVDVRFKFSK